MDSDPLLSAFLGQCAAQSNGVSNSVFGLLLQVLLAAQCALNPPEMWPPDYAPTFLSGEGLKTFDFIIVGAGPAGCVLANRLSEVCDWNVLLIEAGGDPTTESNVPLLYLSNLNTSSSWSFYGEKNPFAGKAMENGNYYPGGKMLGGSSSLNGMVFTRGNKADYDHWEELGNPTWGWENVLKYFKKSEDMTVPGFFERNGYKYHSQGGLQKVGYYNDLEDPLRETYLDAARERGYATKEDYNDGDNMGFYYLTGSIYEGKRYSPARAFLSSAKLRPNLFVLKNTLVTRVVFDGAKRAVGVELEISTEAGIQKGFAEARKEVVVSAGVYKSPQLLQLSGIGRPSQLEKFGISVVQDLPVGFNFNDHSIAMTFFQGPEGADPAQTPQDLATAYYEYLKSQTGFFAGIGLSNTAGFIDTKDIRGTYPDIEMIPGKLPRGGDVNNFAKAFLFPDDVVEVIQNATVESTVYTGLIVLLRQTVTGYIELNSADPHDAPKINSNILVADDDVETLIRGIRAFRNLLASEAYKEYGFRDLYIPLPECNDLVYDSDAYWVCYLRNLGSTSWHGTGTCKMGPDSDPEAVVDPRLRVRGVTGLRVASAAIMPKVPTAHTMAPTIMIGEKAADFIKEDWGFPLTRAIKAIYFSFLFFSPKTPTM